MRVAAPIQKIAFFLCNFLPFPIFFWVNIIFFAFGGCGRGAEGERNVNGRVASFKVGNKEHVRGGNTNRGLGTDHVNSVCQ